MSPLEELFGKFNRTFSNNETEPEQFDIEAEIQKQFGNDD